MPRNPRINATVSGNTVATAVTADDLEVDSGTLSIDADNNRVGVGTTSPSTTLDVSGGITATSGNDATGTIAVRSGDAAQYSKISMGTNANKATLGCAGATDTFFTGTAQDDLVVRADDNNSKVHIGAGTSGPAAMVVTEVANVGKVGIGTTSPGVQLEVQDTTTSSANTGGALRLSANDGATMGDSHRLGVIEFTGAEDTNNTQVVGARIEAITDAAWTNAENGCALYFYTTDGNASQTNVLKIDSNQKSTFSGEIEAASLDISGDCDIDGTLEADAITVEGANLTAIYSPIAGSSSITTTGTVGTGTWQGTAVASAYLDADTAHLSGTQTFTGTKTLNSFKGTGGATVTNILDEDAMGSNSATALATQQSIKAYADTKSPVAGHSSIATVGTIGTGTWQGTAVASAYLDADTAHLSGTQTFTGTKTLQSFKGTGGATVTNILDEDAMGTNSATALATQQSIKAYAVAQALQRSARLELERGKAQQSLLLISMQIRHTCLRLKP